MKNFDVCIIGAGIVGCAIARELAKYKLSICLLEKNEDIAAETTKANSGIVHGGYDAKHGTLKAKFSAKGNSLYQQLDNELHFGFKRIGAFVVGFDAVEELKLQQLYENGLKNGVQNLEIVSGDFVRAQEPYLNAKITSALYCGSVGITSPYEFAIALAENAITNGVELHLANEVQQINKQHNDFIIKTKQETLGAKIVINAAGLYGDHIARLVGADNFFIKPRRGQYLLFDKEQTNLVKHVIFQTPTDKGKGVLVTNTLHGNLMIGPDAQYIADKDDVDTTADSITYVIETARKTLPDFDLKKIITSFAGNRATSDCKDFIIEESDIKGFINVAGIESPGLTAAPAIALYVIELLKELGRCKFIAKENFNPYRKPYHKVANMNATELNKLIQQQPEYGYIVCRCETVSAGEILDALNRPIPINSLDAIKRRTRCGMGRCQGGFCSPKVVDIISENLQLAKLKISKKGKGSELLVGRTKRALKEQ